MVNSVRGVGQRSVRLIKAPERSCVMVRVLLVLCVFCVMWGGQVFAQEDDAASRQRRLAQWGERLRMERLRSREGALLEEVERLDQRRVDIEQQEQLWQKRAEEVKKKVQEAQQEVALQKEICRVMVQTMRPRLRLFYRVSRLGHGRILLGSRTLRAMALRWRLLRVLTAHDLKMLQDYQQLRRKVEQSVEKLGRENSRLKAIIDKLRKQQAQILGYKREKQAALQLIYQEADLYKRAAQEMQQSGQGLTQMLRGGAGQAAAQGATAFKGRLPWPIQGFTPYCEQYKLHQEGSFRALHCEKMGRTPKPLRTPLGRAGITMTVPTGSPIQSVATGRVAYQGWRRGYGLVLILDHGHRFYTVYAHLSSTTTQQGQLVSVGEVIGLSGATGALSGPALYFEVRYPVRPQPPEDWLRAVQPPQETP